MKPNSPWFRFRRGTVLPHVLMEISLNIYEIDKGAHINKDLILLSNMEKSSSSTKGQTHADCFFFSGVRNAIP